MSMSFSMPSAVILWRSYSVVKRGGIIVSITGQPDPGELEKHGIRGAGLGAQPDAEGLEELAELIDAGKYAPLVSAVLRIAADAQAHKPLESGQPSSTTASEI